MTYTERIFFGLDSIILLFAEGDWDSGLSSGKSGKKYPENPVNPVK
jgi:hypothetical protein